jgi:SARP family transcriptional regulator, regulator of embCAB operon
MDATLRTAAWPKVGATLERAQQSPVRDAAAPSVRFYVAGRVAVECSSTLDQGDLPGAQGRRILVHLVLARHRPVPAEELADVLWRGSPPASWDTALRAIVSKLRTALGQIGITGAVAAEGGCYQLRVAGAWVDIEEAERAVHRAEGARRAGDLHTAWSGATVAAGITARPILVGMEDPELTTVRDRCRRIRVRALDVLTAVWLGRGDVQLALHVAQEVVGLEPFREQGYRSLMRCHLAAGNRAEALRVYADCRALLAEELGVEPAPETAGVFLEALAAGD